MAPLIDEFPELPVDPDLGPDDSRRRRGLPGGPRPPHLQLVVPLAVACGGAIGAMARYALSVAMPTVTGRFPWGTLLINVTGCLLLGFLVVVLLERFPGGRMARPLLGTGVIGAYTTFSTYAVEAVLLGRAHRPGVAVLYLLGSVLAGLMATWLGVAGARTVVRAERRHPGGRNGTTAARSPGEARADTPSGSGASS